MLRSSILSIRVPFDIETLKKRKTRAISRHFYRLRRRRGEMKIENSKAAVRMCFPSFFTLVSSRVFLSLSSRSVFTLWTNGEAANKISRIPALGSCLLCEIVALVLSEYSGMCFIKRRNFIYVFAHALCSPKCFAVLPGVRFFINLDRELAPVSCTFPSPQFVETFYHQQTWRKRTPSLSRQRNLSWFE